MQTMEGKPYFHVRKFDTVPEMIGQSASQYGERAAVRFRRLLDQDPQTVTYSELNRDVDALAAALIAAEMSGGRIAIVGENSYHWILAFLATASGVAVVVPLDRLLPEAEILQLLIRGKVDTLFYDYAFAKVFQDSVVSDHGVKRMICMRPERLNPDVHQRFKNVCRRPDGQSVSDQIDIASSAKNPVATSEPAPELFDFNDLLDFGRLLLADDSTRLRLDQTKRQIDPDALMSLLFTSGTTSLSKAVMLSQHNICSNISGTAGVVRLQPGLRMLSILPLHHTFENTCGLLMALYVGACIHVCDGLRYIQTNMKEYAIEMIIGVPAVFENFYQKICDNLTRTNKERLVSRMRPLVRCLRKLGIDLRRTVFRQILDAFGGAFRMGISGAAPIDPEIIRFFDDIGVRILQGYGLTETSPIVAGCNSRVFVPGTVGHPVGGVTVAVDSDEPGGPGEILVKGPNVMLGYYDDEAATRSAIDPDGWFHTGDIGTISPSDGCLRITGRKKSMIVLKSGKKIYPEEVEHLINQFDFIRESMVWGEETDGGDVVVSAKFVVDEKKLADRHGLKPEDNGVQELLDQLIRDVNAKMPSFKSIRHHVYSFKDMVKTTTLKIRRPIELESLRRIMDRNKLRMRELNGKNLDDFHEEPDDMNDPEDPTKS